MGWQRSLHKLGIAVGLWTFCQVGPVLASIHTWDVNEVFSNADGTIQFVELFESGGGALETGVGQNGVISSDTQTVGPFGQGSVVAPTSFKNYLIATQSFADLPGAPTPDVIIPPGSIPFFNTTGDTIDFVVYDSWLFGLVPTNGTDSLDRLARVGPNTPTNYAGVTGFVDVSPPAVKLPTASPVAVGMLVALLGSGGLLIVLRRRAHSRA
jgi:hypothetical protein